MLAAVRAEQIKVLYQAPAIMLANPINASIVAVVLWPASGLGSPGVGWAVLPRRRRAVRGSRTFSAATLREPDTRLTGPDALLSEPARQVFFGASPHPSFSYRLILLPTSSSRLQLAG